EIYSPRSISGLLGRIICRSFYHITMQDNVLWNWKRTLQNPRYAKAEKDLARFRRWFRTFYVRRLPVVEAGHEEAPAERGDAPVVSQAGLADDAGQGGA